MPRRRLESSQRRGCLDGGHYARYVVRAEGQSSPQEIDVSDIETEHRGFKIRFSENQEVWMCYDLDFESPSLLKIRQRIDAHERKKRKKAELVQVWFIDYHSAPHLAWVSSVDEPNTSRYGTDRCWILVEPATAGGKRERLKVDVKSLAPDTEETRQLVTRLVAAIKSRRVAEQSATDAMAAIPRFTREALLSAGVNEDAEDSA